VFPIRRGQTLVEYGLILVLIALVAIGGLVLLGPVIETMFKNAAQKI
jgi:Flp pilus assembly pilin Flp